MFKLQGKPERPLPELSQDQALVHTIAGKRPWLGCINLEKGWGGLGGLGIAQKNGSQPKPQRKAGKTCNRHKQYACLAITFKPAWPDFK